MTESQAVQVFVADEFKRATRNLKKRYRNIESDLQTLIERLQNGDLPGNHISGFADYVVYKVRVKNSDIRKGIKWRLSYHLPKPDSNRYCPTLPVRQV